mmetsp:Transcript_243/g.246  ORF Transcript_243/g.246 Transcript_243/m.246 type:complete len:142 (+) Transcript_243:359-784(+)
MGLCMMIDKAIEELEEIHKEMLENIDWANVIPDKLLKQALDDNTPIMEFKRIEGLALANANNLEEGGILLDKLLKSVKSSVLESTDVIVEFSKAANLAKIKNLGQTAKSQNKSDPREIMETFTTEIESLLSEAIIPPQSSK